MAKKNSFKARLARLKKTTSKSAAKSFKSFGKSIKSNRRAFASDLNRFKKTVAKSSAFKTISKKFKPKRKRIDYGHKIVARKGADIFEHLYPPEAYAVTIAKLKRLGKAIPKGHALNEAVHKEITFRINAVGFLRAGWLSAVATFAQKIGKPVKASTSKFLSRFGHGSSSPMGGAKTAVISNNPFALFWNMAASRHTSTELGQVFAEEGLASAMVQETGRMAEFIARKQQQRTEAVMRKFLR